MMIRASEPPMKWRRSAERRFVDAFEVAPVIGVRIAVGTELTWAMGHLRGLGWELGRSVRSCDFSDNR